MRQWHNYLLRSDHGESEFPELLVGTSATGQVDDVEELFTIK
jgi:hypothetical protein